MNRIFFSLVKLLHRVLGNAEEQKSLSFWKIIVLPCLSSWRKLGERGEGESGWIGAVREVGDVKREREDGGTEIQLHTF